MYEYEMGEFLVYIYIYTGHRFLLCCHLVKHLMTFAPTVAL